MTFIRSKSPFSTARSILKKRNFGPSAKSSFWEALKSVNQIRTIDEFKNELEGFYLKELGYTPSNVTMNSPLNASKFDLRLSISLTLKIVGIALEALQDGTSHKED